MTEVSWEFILGAAMLILGQGGVLHISLRKHVNGLGDAVREIMGETVREIRKDTRQLYEDVHNLYTRVSLVESYITHIKELM